MTWHAKIAETCKAFFVLVEVGVDPDEIDADTLVPLLEQLIATNAPTWAHPS